MKRSGRESDASTPPGEKKPTAIRILDVAEELFAEHGFDATSLGDVADRVGIRQPSLYNHFRNKQELYVAVLERLLDPFLEMVEGIALQGSTPQKAQKLIAELMGFYAQHPHLLRLIQHAVLAGSEHTALLTERWFKPFVAKAEVLRQGWPYDEEIEPFILMAFNSMMMGYVTLAPFYSKMFDLDPLSPESVQKQIRLLQEYALRVRDPESPIR